MVVLLLIMVINLVMGVIFLIYSGKITTAISNKLRGNYITQYFDDDSIKTIFDTLQSEVNILLINSFTIKILNKILIVRLLWCS